MTREPALRVRGLRKMYGGREAVADVDLEMRRGEIFALLGPNGAGKTTTPEILEGHRRRDGGEVAVLGEDPGEAGGPVAGADRDRAPAELGLRPAHSFLRSA
ncbi:ATP-binding cassette domain-containing protein [Streptacidiphilus pinicola]|uniref:ATP-binding cassette domain-containing protein n=1 Tax=Streptacidiphilus pinicola TaxID=2219663 RepID=UPI001A9F144E